MSGPDKYGPVSDRSTDRVAQEQPVQAGQGAETARLAGGTGVRPSGHNRSTNYLTSKRLAELAASLSYRDHHIVDMVTRFRLVSQRQIQQRWFGPSASDARAARRALARLHREQLLDRLQRRIGGVRAGSAGFVYRVGPAGQRLRGERRRTMDEPGLHHLEHTLAVTQLYVDLATAGGATELVVFDPEPAAWRDFIGGHGENVTLKPDAYAELEDHAARRLWFVEVDRGTVSTTTLRKQLRVYRDYLSTGIEQQARGAFPRVVWVTPAGRRRHHLADLLATENDRLGAELHRLIANEWQPPPDSPR